MKAQPVQKTVGGVTFEDRFAHLHEDTPEALEWQWARDRKAQEAAEASPNYRPVYDRLFALTDAGGHTVPRKRGGLWFGHAKEGDDVVLQVSETPRGKGRRLASQKALAEAAGGKLGMMTWFEPSPNGRYVAVAWGMDGDMTGTWSVFESATGRRVLDTPAIAYSGARPGWLPDESGFWLDGRTDQGLHRLRFVPVTEGSAERDEIVLPESLVESKHSGLTLHVSPDGRRGVAVTEPHEHVALVLIDLVSLEAKPFVPQGYHGECDGSWIDGETYVARVNDGAPRGRVVAIPAATSTDRSTWRELVPEGEGFIGWAGVIGNRLYVGDLVDVSLRVRTFDLDGKLIETLPLENPGSSPSMLLERAVRPGEALSFTHSSFTRSPVLFTHDPETGTLERHGEPANRLNDVVAEQRFATSKDGTNIPYFIVYRKNLDTSRPQPALVHGYGGFNISLLPTFPTMFVPFIEAGGIFVQASLRGGAEYGKAWHDAGRLANKQNTFDDLEAVAKTLVAEGVSTHDQMAFMGGSNGGLLAGVAIVQQPSLWRAVVPTVPIFDMLEPLPDNPAIAGISAIFYEDYGNPSVPADAASARLWSPYHNVADGIAYPAVYQVFGEKDLGCMPFHGRKFTARLDEANIGDRPIHLRIWRDTGHGVADPAKAAAWNAEWLAFVMDQLGMRYKEEGQ
ncbi:prolyl oligopeptidase family serine peptidase [Sphingosinicella rhizophila]|uniref:prolyl oligopeptidase n=1 Tax=Sphingosinicella rhizophila TaxID=3050082 RepID=A0ABU3Q970_9SPHN|nr:prolyl oligopeptidase family serine peptidase [Sphingosinicella sp. GR2756]MDT9599926.1 prolyl oligopeptidase family serine peptidase [Sphingosinicella sp. GR2756]